MSTADGDGRPTDGDASASALAAEAAQAAAAAEAAAVEARRRADELARAAAAEQQASAAVPDDPVPDDSVPDDRGPQDPVVEEVRAGYAFDGPVVEIGALVVDDVAVPSAPVRLPLGMLNRHGLVAGATGTGKTRTLQLLAEQVSAHGVPAFAADVKGDLSGIAVPGTPSERLAERCADVGQTWQPLGSPTELLTLGGLGTGVPVRASLESFGPLLLAKVLGLNETQESSLGLVFHHAREQGHRLVDLGDLRSVLTWLVGDGKAELKELGGLSSATVGVILRELVAFADQGADVFFGEPELDVADLLRLAPDGRGVVSLLEVPSVVDRPTLFSTFLLHLLRTLFATLPEVGDVEKPRLVFFFDEAHLLFADASKDFLAQVTQTVRLIRSKGVGIVFVTQTPKDVPSDVLAQLGSRIQHQLRAHTPDDAKALRATVSTYPTSGYDLGELLTRLAIGEAVVTVMDERGAPTPVAWTRLRAPQGSMAPAPADVVAGLVAASPLLPRYGTRVDPPSATEAVEAARGAAEARAEADRAARDAAAEAGRVAREADRLGRGPRRRSRSRSTSAGRSTLDRAVGEASRTLARELAKSLFRRRR
ncbi:DNA helicase HerA-like ATPase [Aeromicrobium sp. SORGH_AS981]|uniref:helicase HerA-like domain-containing protein n=1 Tax=Aeromicrobium sp. SORGH_AS_0981 TaxID=3041802 RepID=UPI00285D018C|nr:helicase HerA-like domain-containing protein [Aeromicrobium sp. SORGH_AS_0981]MDR6117449.1 DNA helicase HerA-like ATPase [Aeromicrobium sp. SORGH_AS_0981]